MHSFIHSYMVGTLFQETWWVMSVLVCLCLYPRPNVMCLLYPQRLYPPSPTYISLPPLQRCTLQRVCTLCPTLCVCCTVQLVPSKAVPSFSNVSSSSAPSNVVPYIVCVPSAPFSDVSSSSSAPLLRCALQRVCTPRPLLQRTSLCLSLPKHTEPVGSWELFRMSFDDDDWQELTTL